MPRLSRIWCHASDERRIALSLFIGITLLYIAISRGVFLYGDDVLMYQVTEGIVERGSVAVTSPFPDDEVVRAVGPEIAFTAEAIPGRDGQGYSKYGIGQSLVAIPAYVLSDLILEPLLPIDTSSDPFGNQLTGPRIYGTALVNALIGGAVVGVTFLLACSVGFQRRTAFVVACLLAFGTLLPHYAATFLSEPLSALCLVTVLLGLVNTQALLTTTDRMVSSPWLWLALSGAAAGLALATRIALGVALIAPGLWLLWMVWWARGRGWRFQTRMLLAWIVPVTGWLVIIALYNWWRFGGLTQTGYGDEATMYTTPFLTGLYGLLLSPGRGVIWYAPPLLLAVAGGWWFWRRKRVLTLVLAGMLVASLLLYSKYYVWYGGGVWGTRFLVPLLPLLVLPAGEIVERAWQSRRVMAAVIGIALFGVVVTALGILVPFDRYVAEISTSTSPTTLEDAHWRVGDSPLVVHARSLVGDPLRPDIAGVRYGSPLLVMVSLVSGLAGVVVVGRLVWGLVRPMHDASMSTNSPASPSSGSCH